MRTTLSAVKPTTLLLSASLLANLALVAVFTTRSSAPEVPPAANPNRAASAPASANSSALQAALASGDVNALIAAGLSPETARELTLARKLAQLAAKARAQATTNGDNKWWRLRANVMSAGREQQLSARRELSEALLAAFGDDLGLGNSDPALLAFLSPAKREALRRIMQDYDEMMSKFGAGGIQLASDKERLRLLRAERERDIAALLSPDEKLAYDLRTSPASATIRNRYGDAIESEAEFQKIFALQKTFDDKFPRDALTGRISPDVLRARSDAERQLDTDLRAALGDERYTALRRASDSDLRNVESLATRLNLPATTTNTVAATRDAYAAESQRINNDTSVSFPQRRTQIQELAARAKTDLVRTLGNEAAEAYGQTSPWVNHLQNGTAYSTTPQANSPIGLNLSSQSVYPVLPAGVNITGTSARQVFVSGTPPPDGVVSSDRALTGGNVQVMTFSTTHTDSATTTTPAPTAGATLVLPAQPTQPAPTPTPKP